MRRLAQFVFVLLLVCSASRAAERDMVRTFSVQPGCTVAIDTYRGAITVIESDRPEVRIAGHLEIGARTAAEAEQVPAGFHLSCTQQGDTISVRARHPAETRARFIWNDDHQIEPTFRITVPRRCNLDLRTIRGSIVVGELSGRIVAHAETGNVFLRHAIGPTDASVDSGELVVSQCDGNLAASVRHGLIRVGVVNGRCDLKNSSGDVEVMEARGDTRVFAEAGTAKIGVPRDFAAVADVSTSGGNVIMLIDPAANCEVRARTSWLGHIACRLPAEIESGRVGGRTLVARLNRGGPKLTVHASGGDVSLEPAETPFE